MISLSLQYDIARERDELSERQLPQPTEGELGLRRLGFYGGCTIPETPNINLNSLAEWRKGRCPVMQTI